MCVYVCMGYSLHYSAAKAETVGIISQYLDFF